MKNFMKNGSVPFSMVIGISGSSRKSSSGEEDFETWMDQASQALVEWDIPTSPKRQGISKTLRGPATKVICNLKLG